MTVGSLFAGIGGFDIGLERAGFTIKWQIENDPYCNRVLAKHWPRVKRYGDIRSIDWRTIGRVDLLCGGFPCQPFSLAGQRRGQDDDRYLWPEMRLAVLHAEPTWVIAENVPGLIGPALDTVLSDLEAAGYEVGTLAVPACAVGAPHIRQRVWILAHSHRHAIRLQPGRAESGRTGADEYRNDGTHGVMADKERDSWPTEPTMGDLVHGVSDRLVRFAGRTLGGKITKKEKDIAEEALKAIGNAIIPQIAEWLGKQILTIEEVLCPSLNQSQS
jgi:DNA (cytosine-5)-methyltransferase 1